MNGIAVSASLMALALLVFPSSPKRRLTARRQVVVGTRGRTCLVAGGAVVAVVTLPLTTILAAATVTATVSLRYRRRRQLRRATEEGRTLEAALEVLVGELRVGPIPCRPSMWPPPKPLARWHGRCVRSRHARDWAPMSRWACGSPQTPQPSPRIGNGWPCAGSWRAITVLGSPP